ncbi:MAG TPA: hypothetical protein VN540_09085 [Clostridia bacterium]|nr:hypothetical protein [Clostridia bacterium]
METTMDNKRRLVFMLSIPASALAALPIYIILHEAGHTLIAWLCGATITDFNVFNAFMSYEGGAFTPFPAALLNAAGMLLPVLCVLLFMLLYRGGVRGVFSRVFSFFLCALPIFSIVAWILVPILYMAGSAPAEDDVTQFLYNSGFHPVLVILLALALIALCTAVFLRSRVVGDFSQSARELVRKTKEK